MSERLYAAAQAGFSGTGSCRRANKTTHTAGVLLRTGKTGCRAAGNCCCTNQTGFNGACRRKTKTGCCAGGYDCKDKIACPAVRSYSRA
jgi:hypothetical protein